MGKRDLKITYENGEIRFILVNAVLSLDEIKDYFINQYFNVGFKKDNMQKCISIELI